MKNYLSMQFVGDKNINLKIEKFQKRRMALQTEGDEWNKVIPASWGYYTSKQRTTIELTGYASMTCAALSSLLICESELARAGELDAELAAQINAAKLSGLAWLQENYSIRTVPPGGGMWVAFHYYYLYSLERVGMMYGIKKIGGHDWYLEGALWLVNAQREDGSWLSYGEAPIVDTAFALLFLKRAVLPVETPTKRTEEKK